ncbi:hypothetical protein [Myxococcus sp. Y35]|uniref:hypothetical protein n=1 Tax=Pseudomyxococcus flavus TaxID=3115648 RepID=UPI003CEF1EB5
MTSTGSCLRLRSARTRTDERLEAYVVPLERGHAHAEAAWARGDEGRSVRRVAGAAFFGESMFALAPGASKVAFVSAVERRTGCDFRLVA